MKNNRCRFLLPNPWHWVIAITIAALLAGCGQKGPPLPIAAQSMTAIKDLHADVSGNTALLTWTYPEDTVTAQYLVLRSQTSDSDCYKCPIRFEQVAKVNIEIQSSDRLLQYTDSIHEGFIYRYMVVPVDNQNKRGPESNLITITK